MSGHSKWHSIKHKKAKVDAQRGKIFTKLIRQIMVAAREGGPDPEKNNKLRLAIEKAKSYNMPNDNIKRAIEKGAGLDSGTNYEEITYEGYGPGGVAVMIEALTDNRNRTAAEVRHIFSKHGGSLGESGCVAWMFERKGVFSFQGEGIDTDKLMELALEAEALDMTETEDGVEITVAPNDFDKFKALATENGFEPSYAEITMVPQTTVKLEGKEAEQMIKLMDELEDHDDVQQVYSNFDISKELMEELSK